MTDIKELREQVAESCRVLGTLDLTKAATGHVSARIPGSDSILIRARGPGELGVRFTTDDQVAECGFDGKIRNAGTNLGAPLEVFIHTEIYKARPEVNSVVHIHPPTVVLFTIADLPLLPIYGSYDPPSLLLALEGIPTYDRSILIQTPELGQDLVKAMGDAPTCMMRGHGITTVGATVAEASLNAIHLNDLAVMNYQARLLGTPRPISAEDQEVFRKSAEGRHKGQGPFAGRAAALWRYYVALTKA